MTSLTRAQQRVLVDIKVLGTFVWRPSQKLASIDSPSKPFLCWGVVDRLLALGMIETAREGQLEHAVLTPRGEREVNRYPSIYLAALTVHGLALAEESLDEPTVRQPEIRIG